MRRVRTPTARMRGAAGSGVAGARSLVPGGTMGAGDVERGFEAVCDGRAGRDDATEAREHLVLDRLDAGTGVAVSACACGDVVDDGDRVGADEFVEASVQMREEHAVDDRDGAGREDRVGGRSGDRRECRFRAGRRRGRRHSRRRLRRPSRPKREARKRGACGRPNMAGRWRHACRVSALRLSPGTALPAAP